MSYRHLFARIWPRAGMTKPRRRPWTLVFARASVRAPLLAYAPIGVALACFGLLNLDTAASLVASAFDSSAPDLVAPKAELVRYVTWALPVSVLLVARELMRQRRARPARGIAWAALAATMVGLPALAARMFEYQQPVLTGVIVASIAAATAATVTQFWPRRELDPALSKRLAWGALTLGYLLFVGWLGFMAHWRFITFHAAAYDMSWETNAVHNIVHHGIPKTSVGSGAYYPGELLPTNYASLHTPWIYYVYAQLYAVYQDARTLVWAQAALMGAGAFGLMLFARKWLRSEPLAAVFGLAYLAYPHVQLYCLHDVHANYLAIPFTLLALGAMEAGKKKLALFLVFLVCICREETAVYGCAIGLFWLGARANVSRARSGVIAIVMSTAILLFITRVVMPGAGGTPRYSHFGMFFDDPGVGGLLKSLLFNPWGALGVFLKEPRPLYVWLSLLPLGFMPLLGWRGLVFLLIPIGLLLPAGELSFFVVGVNYGAPIVAPMFIMGVLGAQRFTAMLRRRGCQPVQSLVACGAFVAVTAGCCSVLYGNVFGKSYKFEFGGLPYRQASEFDDRGYVGIMNKLPPYGERDRLLWDVIAHVPKDAPISTSSRINAQLSNREVSMLYPNVGAGHPAANRAKYVVLDRLPSLFEASEDVEMKLLHSKEFRVFYENPSGIIFERL
jgi:uncharacterized membrane protein